MAPEAYRTNRYTASKHSHASERRGYVLRNTSLGDFVVVRTSKSVLTQTWIVQPATHLGYMV
jgi:hypothetical protein